MTVSTTTLRNDYTGNGVTTAFTIGFRFLDNAHIKVIRTVISTGVSSTLAITTDYTVAGAGAASGGTLTMLTAPTADHRISILRNVPLTQLTDYVANDAFPAESHETALDKLTMISQQYQEQVDRSFKYPENEPNSPSEFVPSLETRRNKVWYWDANGEPTVGDLSAVAVTFSPQVQTFSGDGATVNFTLSGAPGSSAGLIVSIGGVAQRPGVDFSVSNTTLTFTTAPVTGSDNILVQNFSMARTVNSTDANAVAWDGGFADEVLAQAKPLADYTALRAYTGRATGFRITGVLGTAQPQGIAGLFQYDSSDTTSGCKFTGSMSGTTTLTIASVVNGAVSLYDEVYDPATGIAIGRITTFGTGTGGAGTYTVSATATFTTKALHADNGGSYILDGSGRRIKRQSETVRVTHFQADKAGLLDSTYHIASAIEYIDTTEYKERTLVWDGGIYSVGKVDLTSKSYLTFSAAGTVQIVGNDDTQGFIFGTTNYNSGTPSSSTITRSFTAEGGLWLIAPGVGQSYTYGLRLEHFIKSTFNSFYVSGDYGPASGANRIAAFMQYSYWNTFNQCSFGSPGVPGVGYDSYSFSMGEGRGGIANSNNVNTFNNCNATGVSGRPSEDRTFGFRIVGAANKMNACDMSGVKNGLDFTGSLGGEFHCYFEGTLNPVVAANGSGTARGNVFSGGYYEVLTNGTAFFLDATQNTTIISPRVKGESGGSVRTFINQGTSCYGLSVITPDLENIDTELAGTYRGEGGFTKASGKILQTAWLSFPATQVPSSDANTLDDYEEGTWTPVLTFSTPGNVSVTYSSQVGTLTKKGREITAHFKIITSAFTHTTAAGNLQVTGLLHAADITNGDAVGSLRWSGITKAGYTQVSPSTSLNSTTLEFFASGSGVAEANVTAADVPTGGSVIIRGTITYQAAT